jgi:hypothetical protein
MVDAKIHACLASFSEAAQSLRQISDDLNTLILTVEAALIDANVGLEVWVRQPLSEMSKEEGRGTPFWRQLGFAKVNGKWCLAVRELIGTPEEYDEEYPCSREETPLLQASRYDRIASLRLLPALIKAVEGAAKMATQDIENAIAFLHE